MRPRIIALLGSLTAGTLLAACSGGGSGASLSPSASVQPASVTGMKMSVRIPGKQTSSALRSPRFVSTSTNGIGVSYGASPATFPNPATPNAAFDVSSTSALCTANGDGSRTCTFTIPAPPGTDDIQVSAWDGVPSGGAFTGDQLLSQQTVTGQSIVAGQQNALAFVLNGVVNSIHLDLSPATLAAEAPNSATETATLNVYAKDADGNIILGSGNFSDANGNPLTITLTQAGVNGSAVQTTLSATTVTPTTGPITVSYSGGTTNGTIISANPSSAIAGANDSATLTIH
jgi:hypothetical protein